MILLTDFRREIVLPDQSPGSMLALHLMERINGRIVTIVQCGETYHVKGTDMTVRGVSTFREGGAIVAPMVGENAGNRAMVDADTPVYTISRQLSSGFAVRATVRYIEPK